jgi:DNA-binding winged helix-turn-helix (wHTH) protein/tetratricopeptide (TPR) repeat protein
LIYRFENCVLDTRRRELHRDGKLWPMEPQVFDLLEFLVRNRDRVVTKDDLLEAVWRRRIVSDVAISSRINAARKAVGDDGGAQRLIRTLRRQGFRFVATLCCETVGAEAACLEPPARPLTVNHRLGFAVKGAPVLVVAPLSCIGDDGVMRVFAEGLGEEISAALRPLDWLFVVSNPASVLRPASAPRRAGIVGRLGARYRLQGSVRRHLGTVRVHVTLVDVASGCHLWTDRHDADICDVIRGQERIASAVSAAIGDQVFAAEHLRASNRDGKALIGWDAIVKSLVLINTRNKLHAAVAQALLRKAVAAEPKSAAAFGLLSFVATLGVHQGWQSRDAARTLALGAAERAIALNAEEPWARLASGYAQLCIGNRPEQAIELLDQALALNPNLAIGHYLIALGAAYMGDPARSLAHADLAERLTSRDLLSRGNAGVYDNVRATASFVAGRYGDGVVFARRAIARSPRQAPAYRQLVVNGALAGELRDASAALQEIRRLAPDVERTLDDTEKSWTSRSNYKRYLDAFRLAGHR